MEDLHLDMLLIQQDKGSIYSWSLTNQDTESSLGLPRSHDRLRSIADSQSSVPDQTPKDGKGGSVGTGCGGRRKETALC